MQQSTANPSPIQRRITLIRHAKAEEGDGADIARRLNARSEGDAAKLGQWLQAEDAFPQVFLCSTAQRTRQTLALISPPPWGEAGRGAETDSALRGSPHQSSPHPNPPPRGEGTTAPIPTILSERLYLASAKEVLKFLTEMDDAVMNIGVVGHNPGLHQLAAMLVRDYKHEDDAERLALKFPTATCAIFSAPLAHWRDLAPRTMTLDALVTPTVAHP